MAPNSLPPENPADRLVVAITARALFDLEDSHALFQASGVDAYAEYQRSREREVLGLIVEGLTNKEIGRALELSPRTVETHRANLFAKLGAESLAQLIRRYAALVDAHPNA